MFSLVLWWKQLLNKDKSTQGKCSLLKCCYSVTCLKVWPPLLPAITWSFKRGCTYCWQLPHKKYNSVRIQGPSWSQSVIITTNVVSSNPVHGKVYSIQHYVIMFVGDLWQVGGFLRVLWFLPRYNWNNVENGIKYHKRKAKLIFTTYLWVFDKERLWHGPM